MFFHFCLLFRLYGAILFLWYLNFLWPTKKNLGGYRDFPIIVLMYYRLFFVYFKGLMFFVYFFSLIFFAYFFGAVANKYTDSDAVIFSHVHILRMMLNVDPT